MNELEALESLAPLFQGGTMPLLDPVPIHPMFVRELESPAPEASCSVSDEKRTERFLAYWFNFLQLLKSSYSVPALIHGY
jgi:hypothetical protein